MRREFDKHLGDHLALKKEREEVSNLDVFSSPEGSAMLKQKLAQLKEHVEEVKAAAKKSGVEVIDDPHENRDRTDEKIIGEDGPSNLYEARSGDRCVERDVPDEPDAGRDRMAEDRSGAMPEEIQAERLRYNLQAAREEAEYHGGHSLDALVDGDYRVNPPNVLGKSGPVTDEGKSIFRRLGELKKKLEERFRQIGKLDG